MTGARLLTVALLATLLGACIPTSDHPLTKPAVAVADERLAGLWSKKKGDETAYAHFIPDDGANMEIILISSKDDGNGDWSVFSMFPSHIGGTRYMNVRGLIDNGKPMEEDEKAFYFARYRISDDGALSVWGMNPKAVIAAIEGKLLKGTVSKGRWVDTIRITASTEELARYVASADPKRLFDRLIGTFRR